MTELAIATYDGLPELSSDCRHLLPALRDVGVEPRIVDWEQTVPEGPTLIRSVWNYYQHLGRFLDWAESVGGPLFNPAEVVAWNANKRYLGRLASLGIAVVPSIFLESADPDMIRHVVSAHGWPDIVVKPTTSANAWRTIRIRDGVVPAFRRYDIPVVVQPYLRHIESNGEWSFIFIDGEYSHAVLKRPKDGDFRVQDDWGGSVATPDPGADLIEQARSVVAKAGIDDLLYARVDGVVVEDVLMLMELELIEPELFLRVDPDAPARLAGAIAKRI